MLTGPSLVMQSKLPEKKEYRALVLVLAGALIVLGAMLRLGAVTGTTVINPVFSDASDYLHYAQNLRVHGVYSRTPSTGASGVRPQPDAVRAPGYPLFIALITDEASPRGALRVVFVQTIFSVLAVALTFVIGIRILPPLLALVATGLVAISPHLININVYCLTETLSAFVLVIAVWQLFRGLDHDSAWRWLAAGAAIGVAVLVRPVIQYFPLFVLVLILASGRHRRLYHAGAFMAGVALLVLPWTIRNLMVLGITSDSELMINFLHHGLYPGFMFEGDPETYGYPYHHDPESPVITQSVASVVLAVLHRLADEPIAYLRWMVLEKPVFFWSWDLVQGVFDTFQYDISSTPYLSPGIFDRTHTIARVSHWPLVAMAGIASLLVWLPKRLLLLGRATSQARLLALLLIYFTMVHMIGAPFPRYSIPLRPFLYIAAMLAPLVIVRLICLKWRSSG